MSLDTTIPPLPPNAAQEAGGNLDQLVRLALNPAVQFDDDGALYVNPQVPGADLATGAAQLTQIALASAAQPPLDIQDVSGVITGPNETAAQVTLNGATRVVMVCSGTYSGITIFFEGSLDGVLWLGLRAVTLAGAPINGSSALVTNATQAFFIDVAGLSFFRARSTLYGSGQLNLLISPSLVGNGLATAGIAVGQTTDGTAAAGNPLRVGGWDGINIHTLLTDATGILQVNAPATQNVNVQNPSIAVTGSLTTTPPTTPTITQDDDAEYDDDGYRYVNPNVPGADIATGDKQSAQIALAESAQAPLELPDTLGAITGVGDIVGPVALNGASRVVLSFSGTYSGISLIFEASQEGTNWYSVRGINFLNALPVNGNTSTSNNSNSAFVFDVAGWNFWRVRCSAYTSGQMNAVVSPVLYAQPLGVNAAVSGTSGAGAAATGFPVLVAGSDGTDIRTLLTDPTGILQVNAPATQNVNVINASLAVTGSLATTPPSTPTIVARDDQTADDDGIPYVNPNVPGADIATGDRQNQEIALLQQIASAEPPAGVLPPVQGSVTSAPTIIGPVALNGAARIQLAISGTYAAGAVFNSEVSQDGQNWFGISGMRGISYFVENAATSLGVNELRANAYDVSGWAFFRARFSAFGSGQCNVFVQPVANALPGLVAAHAQGLVSAGNVSTIPPVTVGGLDSGGAARNLQVDTLGRLNVNQGQGLTLLANAWPISITDGTNGPVSVQPGTPALPSEASLTVIQSPVEPGGGPSQRTADLLEAILLELRVHTVLLSNLGQAQPDNAESLRTELQVN